MKLSLLITLLLSAGFTKAESLTAPIQCHVKTKVGESEPQYSGLAGMTDASLIKELNSWNGTEKEVFKYQVRVNLSATNIYTIRITDLNNDQTVSTDLQIQDNSTSDHKMSLEKNYAAQNGMTPIFPRFTLGVECQLRSQYYQSNPIPPLTPGSPIKPSGQF